LVVDLWGEQKKVDVEVLVDDEVDNDTLFNLIFPSIKKSIAFVNEQRSEIEQALIDDKNVELANDWAESAPVSQEEENCYIMNDGQKVYLPITEEDFRKNIRIDEAEICFSDSFDDISTHLLIGYTPDIFAGHVLDIDIDKDNKITCIGLAG